MKSRRLFYLTTAIALGVMLTVVFMAQAAGIGGNRLFLPVVMKNYDPDNPPPTPTPQPKEPVTITLETSSPAVDAGTPVTLTAKIRDEEGELICDSFFDVYVQVNGRGNHYESFVMTSNLDGTYTGIFTSTGSGPFGAETLVFDQESNSKWDQVADTDFEVIPTEIVELNLKSIDPMRVQISARDKFANPIPLASLPKAGGLECDTDMHPVFDVAVGPDPQNPEWAWAATVRGSQYEMANLTCTETDSGVNGQIEVGYPPVWLKSADQDGNWGSGFQADSFFDVFVEIPAPADAPDGWKQASGTVEVEVESGVTFEGCVATDPSFDVLCEFWFPDPTIIQISFQARFSDTGGVVSDTVPFTMSFKSPYVTPTLTAPLMSGIHLTDFQLIDPVGIEIPTFTEMFIPLWNWDWLFKPTKTLKMHVYLVEGSATEQQVKDDVTAAENGFNLNAWVCNCDFFINFELTITLITTQTWEQIDEDGDGLDRFDSNGDGDYEDAGDNDDLSNAKDKNYYDSTANTENIYYVPSIRGGALGSTYSPDGQVAVDNSKDGDNLTLMHEKVHELDLRKDDVFDINDSPDDAGNAQGARNAGNIMNYDKPGPWLTRTQCEALGP